MIVLYIILGIICLFFVVAALLPSSYKIVKEITIKAPVNKVFMQVADFNNYVTWNPFQKMEPNAKNTITGEIAQVGHKFKWEGKKIGEGQLSIKAVTENKSIDFNLEFFKPWKSVADDGWKFEDLGNGEVKATWANSGALPYPMARLMGAMIRKNLSKHFEDGLKDLKAKCEK